MKKFHEIISWSSMKRIGIIRSDVSIVDEVEVGLTEIKKATNDTQQQPKLVSKQCLLLNSFLLNNQQLNALK